MGNDYTSIVFESLRDLARSRQLSRREVIRRATWMGLTGPVVAALVAACGDDEAEPTATTAAAPTATRAASAAPTSAPSTAAPTTATTAVKPARDQTFRYPTSGAIRTLEPHGATETGSIDVTQSCHECLVFQAPRSSEIVPRLAKSWDVDPNAQVFTFKLQEGVKFSDGSLMDATAVKKSFERCIQLNLGPAAPLSGIDTIEAVDQFTVRFTLKEPNAFFVPNMTRIVIVSPTAIEQHDKGGDLGTAWFEEGNTAGTGPYTLTDYRKNEIAVMEAFKDYWRGWEGNHLQKINYETVPQITTQRQMLERGEAHYVRNLLPEDAKSLETSSVVKVEYTQPAYMLWTMPIATTKGPTDDVKVRQALQYAFPYDAVKDRIWFGHSVTPNGPTPPGFLGYDQSLPQYKQDLDRAKQLLAEAGVTNLTVSHFYTETLAAQQQVATVFQDVLKGLGITFEVTAMPWNTQFKNFQNIDTAPNTGNLLIGPVRADPAFTLEWMFGSSFVGKPYNWSFYSNAKVDDLIKQARSTPDAKRSDELLKEASRQIAADATVIWYAIPDRTDTYSAKMQDWAPIVVGYPGEIEFYPMWIAE